jgi:hypothetical protein
MKSISLSQTTISPDIKAKRAKMLPGDIPTTTTTSTIATSTKQDPKSSSEQQTPKSSEPEHHEELTRADVQSTHEAKLLSTSSSVAEAAAARVEMDPTRSASGTENSVRSQEDTPRATLQTGPPQFLGYRPEEAVIYQDPPPRPICQQNFEAFKVLNRGITAIGIFLSYRMAKNMSTKFKEEKPVANLAEPITGAVYKAVLETPPSFVRGEVVAISGKLQPIGEAICSYGHELNALKGEIATEAKAPALAEFRRPGKFYIEGGRALTNLKQPHIVSYIASIIGRARYGYHIAFRDDHNMKYHLQWWGEFANLVVGQQYRFSYVTAFRDFETNQLKLSFTVGCSTYEPTEEVQTQAPSSNGVLTGAAAVEHIPLDLNVLQVQLQN